MFEFKKKNEYRFWHSPLALFLLFCFLIVFIYNVVGLMQKDRETNMKKSLVLDEIDSLSKREASLSLDIKKLETEEGIEDLIREKYQVVKEGEKMVVIVDEEEKKVETVTEDNAKHGFVEWLKNIFKK